MSVIKVSILGVTEGEAQKIFNAIGRSNEDLKNRSYFQHCGFSSIPRKSAIGVVVKDDDNYTMIASADHEDDRPVLSNDGDCCMYSSKNRYIKIDNGTGDITMGNEGNSITLKSNGDINMGEGTLKKLMTSEMISVYNSHTHSVSGASTLIPNQLLSAALHATSKVKGE